MSDLDGEPIISYSEETNPNTAHFHKQLFEKFGCHMNIVKTINNLDSGFFSTGRGQGVFMIPRHLSFMAGEMHVIPVNGFETSIPLNLIWKRGNDKAALSTFVKDFTKFYNDEF